MFIVAYNVFFYKILNLSVCLDSNLAQINSMKLELLAFEKWTVPVINLMMNNYDSLYTLCYGTSTDLFLTTKVYVYTDY